MKKLTDEEIQQLLDTNIIFEPSEASLLYQKVFGELSKSPNVHVDHLAQDVVSAVQNRFERRAVLKTHFIIAISLAIAFFVFVIAAFSVDKLLTLRFLSLLNNFKWVVVFLFAVIYISTKIDNLTSINKHN